MALLTIYQLEDVQAIEGLKDRIDELGKHISVDVRREHAPAVVGELAGMAVDLLMSPPVQVTLSSIAVGQIIWQIIDLARRAGKKLHIEKPIAKLLVATKAIEAEKETFPNEEIDPKRIVVYGPMDAEPESGFAEQCFELWDSASAPVAHFMAVVFPRPRNRVRTVWYLFSGGGDVCASWSTQTFSERLPDFLNPNKQQCTE